LAAFLSEDAFALFAFVLIGKNRNTPLSEAINTAVNRSVSGTASSVSLAAAAMASLDAQRRLLS
jgi:hypothetical protein